MCRDAITEGLVIDHAVELRWKHAGLLDELSLFGEDKAAAGLYAFVLDGIRVLYVGKAGGLKPEHLEKWTKSGIRSRVNEHWKSGPFRGLVRTLGCKIHVWYMDVSEGRKKKVWERDLERIENEVIEWFATEGRPGLPGNGGFEGTVPRRFGVDVRASNGPLPSVFLTNDPSPDNRRSKGRAG